MNHLFEHHLKFDSNYHDTILDLLETLCKACCIPQLEHLLKRKYNILLEVSEEDLLDIFYILFDRFYIDGANYTLELDMIKWYYTNIVVDMELTNIDFEHIIGTITECLNIHMLNLFVELFPQINISRILNVKLLMDQCKKNADEQNELQKSFCFVEKILDDIELLPNQYSYILFILCNFQNRKLIEKVNSHCTTSDNLLSFNKSLAFRILCIYSNLSIIIYFMKKWNMQLEDDNFINACANDLSVVMFFDSHLKLSNMTCLNGLIKSCQYVRLPIIKYLINNYSFLTTPFCINSVYKIICETGNHHTLILLSDKIKSNMLLFDHNESYNAACKNNNLLVLQIIDSYFADQTNRELSDVTVEYILMSGHYTIVKYLLSRNYSIKFEPYIFESICRKKTQHHIELAKLFVEYNPNNFYLELNVDHSAILKYSVKNILKIDENSICVSNIEECIICKITNANVITTCMHQYCYECLNDWYMRSETCPTCRRPIDVCYKIELNTLEK